MQARFDVAKVSPSILPAMLGLEKVLHQSGLDEGLLHLIKLRASQINGCAYCIDMHWKDSRAYGEGEQRLYSLDAWRECGYYSDRERAALNWTEAVTRIAEGQAPDEAYEQVRAHFTEKEIADLTFAIAVINTWNRMSIASRNVPGGYESQVKRKSSEPKR